MCWSFVSFCSVEWGMFEGRNPCEKALGGVAAEKKVICRTLKAVKELKWFYLPPSLRLVKETKPIHCLDIRPDSTSTGLTVKIAADLSSVV